MGLVEVHDKNTEKRPVSCKVYPFAWVQPGLLLLYQCPMGKKVTAELLKFAEMSGFKVEKADPEKEAAAIGLDGKVITVAIVPYALLREYYENLKLNRIPVYIRDKI